MWKLMVRYEHSFMPRPWVPSNIQVSTFADCLPHIGRRYSCGGFVVYRAAYVCREG
jgi:hypothetical protein